MAEHSQQPESDSKQWDIIGVGVSDLSPRKPKVDDISVF